MSCRVMTIPEDQALLIYSVVLLINHCNFMILHADEETYYFNISHSHFRSVTLSELNCDYNFHQKCPAYITINLYGNF